MGIWEDRGKQVNQGRKDKTKNERTVDMMFT